MNRRRPLRALAFLSVIAAVVPAGGRFVFARALAQPAPAVTTIHPIFAAGADVPETDLAHRYFTAAATRHQFGPVEVMDIPGPPAPKAKGLVVAGKRAVEQKQFEDAEKALSAAANEVMVTGAAGLTTAELADLFLYLGMALQKADWKDPIAPVTDITPPAAKVAYLRAAVLAPERTLLPRQFPPLAIASWQLAVGEVKKRPRANLVVRAPATALVSIDAGELKSGILPALELPQGEHWVRVEDPGRKPYGVVIPLSEPSTEIEVEPQPVLPLPDAPAAAAARRQGAAFALVAEVRPGRPTMMQLRLVQASSGQRRDSTLVPATDASAVEAAVARLDELARKERFAQSTAAVVSAPALGQIALAPVEARERDDVRLSDSPRAWVKQRWPLLTAVGVAVGTALVLGVLVAHDDGK